MQSYKKREKEAFLAQKVRKTDKVSESSTKVVPIQPFAETTPSEMDSNLVKQMDFLANIAIPSFQSASDSRRKYDQEWLGRNLFWRGYQFSRYLPQSQTVVLSVRQSARVPVNLTAAYMRSIRNQVTSFRPKFEVLPSVPDDESAEVQARYAQRLLDYYFDKLKLKMKIKETIIQALMYSIGGPWQIVYDEVTGDVKVWLLDPFDFYLDPLAEDPNEAEYMIKAVRMPLGEVTSKQEWNLEARKEITGPSQTLAASPQKQFLLQTTRIISAKMQTSSPFTLVYEGFFRRWNEETGKRYMVHCIWTESNQVPLLYEELDTDEFDFIVYRGDIVPKEPYGESWIKHVMAINRVINTLESSTLEYNSRVAKGRFVVDRDAGVRAIHNVHGEIISKNRGSAIQPLDLPPLPPSVPDQVARMLRFSEDIAGVHDASLGRVPQGVRTGIGIAELKQSDSTSQDDLVDNLEDFLSDVAFKILKKVAQNVSAYKVIRDLGVREGDEKYFAVIGKKFAKGKKRAGDMIPGHEGQVKIGPDWFDVAEIGDDNTIRVTVGSWLGYTKEALQQKVLTYFQLGLIDQATTLRLLEFGDVSTIIEQTRREMQLKKGLNAQPGQPGQQVDQYDLAQAENDMIVESRIQTLADAVGLVTPDQDHAVHIAVHQEALGQGKDELIGELIEAHKVMMASNVGMPSVIPPAPAVSPQMGPQSAMQQPGQAPPPAPPGPPPGQGLPQQNLEAVSGQNANNAAMAMPPPGVI